VQGRNSTNKYRELNRTSDQAQKCILLHELDIRTVRIDVSSDAVHNSLGVRGKDATPKTDANPQNTRESSSIPFFIRCTLFMTMRLRENQKPLGTSEGIDLA
jgi:hypothetical protein